MTTEKKTLDRPKIVTKNLNIRVRPDQMVTWHEAAKRDGMELSEWVRDTLDRRARK